MTNQTDTNVELARAFLIGVNLAAKIYFVRKAAAIFGITLTRRQTYVLVTAINVLRRKVNDEKLNEASSELVRNFSEVKRSFPTRTRSVSR